MLKWCLSVAILCMVHAAMAQERSSLYPVDWKPGFTDAEGRFLHDFSYAGYHKGEIPIPARNEKIVDVTQPPYSADRTGQVDSSPAIQKALDDVGSAGGGIVLLPAGTYRLKLQPSQKYCIALRYSNTILRGEGMGRTRLFCDETVMRQCNVIAVRPDKAAWWFSDTAPASLATQDALKPTTTIAVDDTQKFAAGDLVAVRCDGSSEFIAELNMSDKWTPKQIRGITLARRVTAIDPQRNVVTIDAPTRYPMKVRDRLRIYKIDDTNLRESAVEDLSIGMRENPKEKLAEEDYRTEGTAAYETHASFALHFTHCEDSWTLRVGSYHPESNLTPVHLQSNGLRLSYCRQVSVLECDFRLPQYRGGGGNGYLYTTNSNDCLFKDCLAVAGRHNFDLQGMSCVGNVFTNCTTRDGMLASDYHMYFSTANLFDMTTCDGDFLECVYRPYGGTPVHGVTGSQNVFWNTIGLRYSRRKFIIHSKQFGNGYVIGTQGEASAVSTETTDFTEFAGSAQRLTPQSLWADQLERRLGTKR